MSQDTSDTDKISISVSELRRIGAERGLPPSRARQKPVLQDTCSTDKISISISELHAGLDGRDLPLDPVP